MRDEQNQRDEDVEMLQQEIRDIEQRHQATSMSQMRDFKNNRSILKSKLIQRLTKHKQKGKKCNLRLKTNSDKLLQLIKNYSPLRCSVKTPCQKFKSTSSIWLIKKLNSLVRNKCYSLELTNLGLKINSYPTSTYKKSWKMVERSLCKSNVLSFKIERLKSSVNKLSKPYMRMKIESDK